LLLTILALLCQGSWASTLKLGGGKRRFELFYFDCALGVIAMALVCGFTFGNWGFDGFSAWGKTLPPRCRSPRTARAGRSIACSSWIFPWRANRWNCWSISRAASRCIGPAQAQPARQAAFAWSQAVPLVAALWGLLFWQEFQQAGQLRARIWLTVVLFAGGVALLALAVPPALAN